MFKMDDHILEELRRINSNLESRLENFKNVKNIKKLSKNKTFSIITEEKIINERRKFT